MRLAGSSLPVLMLVALSAAIPLPPVRGSAEQSVECPHPLWGESLAAFETRVAAYLGFRHEIEETGTISSQSALAARIRTARARARQGDLFAAPLSAEIKRSLRLALDADTLKVIMDDNPGEIPSRVNDEYREGAPLSTMPPNILAALPRVPEGLEYRFVERHLILLDTRARVILDRIPYAIGLSVTPAECR